MNNVDFHAYAESGGTVCPFCKSSDLEGGFPEVASGRVEQPVHCLGCSKGWTDTYTLASASL